MSTPLLLALTRASGTSALPFQGPSNESLAILALALTSNPQQEQNWEE